MIGGVARLFAVLAAALVFTALPALVSAQEADAPVDESLGIVLPGITNFAPFTGPAQSLALGDGGEVTLSAKLTDEGGYIRHGLIWRIFGQETGPNGKLPLIASAQGGTVNLQLAPGGYLVHASYGRAGATKRITVAKGTKDENLVLDAGGLKLDAVLAGGVRIPPAKLKFSIYEGTADTNGERALIIPDVSPNSVIRLNSGTYHIVSTYGSVNAVIRSDIRIEAGKLTEATVEHKAAEITFKLVRESGGEAMADTSWSLISGSGDPVREVVGAFASLVLAEGDYTIIAKNRDRIYQRDITVVGGRNHDVEVLATPESEVDIMDAAD